MSDAGHNGGPQIDPDKGFINLYRSWQDHPLVGLHNPEYYLWWIVLLQDAKWQGETKVVNGHCYELSEGDFIGAVRFLAKRFKIGEQRVRTFTAKLIEHGLISPKLDHSEINTQANTHKGTRATVYSVNYYNEITKFVADRRHADQHAQQQATNTQLTRNQHKLKEVKEIKETTATSAHDDLYNQLLSACNGALDNPVNCQGLLNLSIPLGWLNNGADLHLDVIPTLQAVGTREHGRRINSWSYFTRPIAEAKRKREAGFAEMSRKPTARELQQEAERERLRKVREELDAFGEQLVNGK